MHHHACGPRIKGAHQSLSLLCARTMLSENWIDCKKARNTSQMSTASGWKNSRVYRVSTAMPSP